MKSYSLRRAALLSFVPALMLTIAVTMGAAMYAAHRTIDQSSDASMTQLASTLNVLTRHEALEGEDIAYTLGSRIEQSRGLQGSGIAFRIWGDGQVITSSANLPQGVLGTSPGQDGFRDVKVDSRRWRILTVLDADNGIAVEIAQDLRIRNQLVEQVGASLIWPLVIMLPVIIAVMLFGLDRILVPLRALSGEIEARDASRLDPVRPKIVPREILPLIGSLNSLLDRVKQGLDRERDFTDTAAHELRTPLAALKTRAQVTSRLIPARARARDSMNELLSIVDRTTALVDQMLALARRQTRSAAGPCDLSRIARGVVSQILATEGAGRQIATDITPDVRLDIDTEVATSLLRNLLENALRHTPEATPVAMSLSQDAHGTCLVVCDQGPGIAAADRATALHRFSRLNTQAPGSGLGLAIAADICDQTGGRLELGDNSPRGLRVAVTWPNVTPNPRHHV
ncbi:hypothetical protein ABAC460_18870 [Asticcacaulis sp. AC460]|uniref:ATP-binding protein n=1 Tax=Asticcacaulis sp. AC460 TaxID=1282360 RepID=UPI0003C3AD7D|nr:ATP-binding protein [Asticcacaulis sp. AC460]ESQ87738.1 hypothetical protein ABAC460_18870 [Asticcacaulis sp. AC460]